MISVGFMQDQIIGETKHMDSAEILLFIIIGILGGTFVTLAVLDAINIQKQDKEYQDYVDSIRIGDTFGHDLCKFSDIGDPFSENYGTPGFDPQYHVTILDIKKNTKGETWVKYCFTKRLNEDHCEWTEEINNFLRYRTRISKRIDNINTTEN